MIRPGITSVRSLSMPARTIIMPAKMATLPLPNALPMSDTMEANPKKNAAVGWFENAKNISANNKENAEAVTARVWQRSDSTLFGAGASEGCDDAGASS